MQSVFGVARWHLFAPHYRWLCVRVSARHINCVYIHFKDSQPLFYPSKSANDNECVTVSEIRNFSIIILHAIRPYLLFFGVYLHLIFSCCSYQLFSVFTFVILFGGKSIDMLLCIDDVPHCVMHQHVQFNVLLPTQIH